MKRFLYVCCLAACILSCTKEKQDETEVPSAGLYSIRASLPDLKVSVSAAGKTTWCEGDALAVFADSAPIKFTLSEGAGTSEGVFTTAEEVRGKAFNGVAAYPYDASVSLEGKALTLVLPTEWSTENIAAPMVGTTDGDAYVFRNVAALLRVRYSNLPARAGKVRVTASNTIAGSLTLPDYETGNLSLPESGAETTVTVSLPTVRPDATASVDIPIPAGTLSTAKIELLDAWNAVLDTKNADNRTFTAGKIKPMQEIALAGDNLKVEWVWDAGNTPTFRGSVPAIDDNGNVYVASNGAAVYKLDNSGKLLWQTGLNGIGGNVDTSPTIEKDGSAIYFAGGQDAAGKLYALNSDGSVKWAFSDFPYPGVSVNFWQTMIGLGKSNIYVPVGTQSTMISVNKANGTRVAYGANSLDGSSASGGSAGSGSAISLAGTVSYMSQMGAFSWNKALMDSPTKTNTSYGAYVPYGYSDLWAGWGPVKRDKGGVIAAKKGTSDLDVIISCAQEAEARYDVVCTRASYGLGESLARHDDSNYKVIWRYRIGNNSNGASDPADQDQGGIVMGHENLVVIVPMKYRAGNTDAKMGNGGLFSIWAGRTADGGCSTCWRVDSGIRGVSGSAAVDNNGNVHFVTDSDYWIVEPNTDSGGSYKIKSQTPLRQLLLSSGKVQDVEYTGAWTSVKIANDGKIYLNLNLNSIRGITCCLSYPGVTGPDATSSWPQKGADQYNSCNQQL